MLEAALSARAQASIPELLMVIQGSAKKLKVHFSGLKVHFVCTDFATLPVNFLSVGWAGPA
jgi:hypothetical protein